LNATETKIIQVNCPGCQKIFSVRPEDLAPGEAQFKCTACSQLFAFLWPTADGSYIVHGRPLEIQTKPCVHCGESVARDSRECPKCGVIFDRLKKPKEAPAPVIKVQSSPVKNQTFELNNAWSSVKANYDSESAHEFFIQSCLGQENLAFAGQQYRSVLDLNPTDAMAIKMQNRIVNLATLSYLAGKQTALKSAPKKFGTIAKGMILVSSLLIFSGIFSASARPLIALGASVLVFIFTARYFSSQQD
jgi:hypothetical protein